MNFALEIQEFLISESVMAWTDEIQLRNGNVMELKKCVPTPYNSITRDLRRLKLSDVLSSTASSKFVHVGDACGQMIFLYKHTGYMLLSSVTTSMVEYFCKGSISTELEDITCVKDHHHDYLLPYFYANSSLRGKLQKIIGTTTDVARKNQAEEMLKNLEDVLNARYEQTELPEICKPYSFPHSPNTYANDYDENVWTDRLFHSLKLFHNDFTGKLTAGRSAKDNLKHIRETYPKVPAGAYIFRGAPDFTISRSPVVIGTSEEEVDSESTDGDIAQVEHGYQMGPLSSHQNNSHLPEKLGQLVAAIQQNIVGKVFTSIVKGKIVNPPFVGYGLFIHKVTGAILVKLQMGQPTKMGGPSLVVSAQLHGSGQVTKKSLCCSIDTLLHILQPKRQHQS